MKSNDATKLMKLLQRIFRQQALDAATKVRIDSDAPDMTPWVRITAEASKPILLALAQQGMVQAAARIAAKRGKKPSPVTMPAAPVPQLEGIRRYTPGNESIFGERKQFSEHLERATEIVREWPAWKQTVLGVPSLSLKNNRTRVVCKAKQPDLDFAFDLFNPRVLDAVDAAAYKFCRETMETATVDTNTALLRLRQLMAEGLPRGDAIALLAKEIRRIFADPYRAFRIATTETSSAVHGGQALAAVEAGINHHTWLASSDACELCLSLDGKTVRIGTPFYVDPRGGPYSVKIHPPAHPFCFCTVTEEIGDVE